MLTRSTSLLALSLLSLTLACGGGGGGSSSSTTAPPSTSASTVIYLSYATGTADIYAIKADGTGNTPLATTSDDEVARVISGDRLIYTRTTAAQTDLLSVKLDGTGTAVMAASAGNDLFVGMAGARAIYVQQNASTYDLRSVNPDGTGNLLLAANVLSDAYARSILLDGSQVVFTSLAIGAGDLYSVQADGTALTRLTSGATEESVSGSAQQSLDSATGLIVYTRDDGSGNSSVHAIKPDGTGHVQLTTSLPQASPAVIGSGRVVYWTLNASGGYSIYSVKLDGTGTIGLAADPTLDQRGTMLDGGRLVYEITRSSSVRDVHAVNLDGTGAVQLSPSGQEFSYQGVIGDQVVLWQGNYVAPPTRIFLAKPDGTALTPLTPDGANAFYEGSWNGRVYYELQQAGQIDLFNCALDGSDVRTLGARTDLNEQGPMQANDRVVYTQYQTSGGYAGVVSVKEDGSSAITLAPGPCTAVLIH